MIENKFELKGKSRVWIYNGGCEYNCTFHKGKVEFHHPISNRPDVGVNLCEAHHSLIKGRKKKYWDETAINKSIAQMRYEVISLVNDRIKAFGCSVSQIDKY
jgi:hypothetical protein